MLYEAFLTYLQCELNYSVHTVVSYRRDIDAWRLFAREHDICDDPAAIDINALRLWFADMAAKGLAPRTIRRRLQAMRAFFAFLMRRRGFSENPAADISVARIPHRLPDTIRPDEVARVIDMPIESDDISQVQQRLIIDMLYSTGIRASEMVALRDADVDTRLCSLKVMGKRSKERIIPFGPELARLIDQYRCLRDADRAAPPQAFFLTTSGKPVYYSYIYKVVHRALDGAVRAAHRSPHVLRHSFATDMLNNGADITAVQHLLGHESLATTQIYTHLTYSELQHNYQLAHPRAQKKGG